jgi:hypothetical protein
MESSTQDHKIQARSLSLSESKLTKKTIFNPNYFSPITSLSDWISEVEIHKFSLSSLLIFSSEFDQILFESIPTKSFPSQFVLGIDAIIHKCAPHFI